MECQGHLERGSTSDKGNGWTDNFIILYTKDMHKHSQMSNFLLHGFLGSGPWRLYRIAVLSDANRESTYAPPWSRSARTPSSGSSKGHYEQRAGKTRGLDEERNRLARDSYISRNYIRTHSENRSSITLPPVKDKAMLFTIVKGFTS